MEIPDVYIFLLIAGIVVLLARRPSKVGWAETGLSLSLVILALSGVRHIPLACIGSVPLIAASLARNSRYVPARAEGTVKPVAGLALIAVVVLLALWRYPCDVRERYARAEPVRGSRALSALDRDLRVFTTYNTGSFVSFADPARLKVFVDSRADVYGDEILTDAYRAMCGTGWESLAERWDFDAAVVDRAYPLARVLSEHDDWTLLAKDASALTFLRRASPRIDRP